MSATDLDHALRATLASAVSEASGIPLEDLDNIVVVYEQADGTTGMLTLACCQAHGSRMLASGIAALVDAPVPDRLFHCQV